MEEQRGSQCLYPDVGSEGTIISDHRSVTSAEVHPQESSKESGEERASGLVEPDGTEWAIKIISHTSMVSHFGRDGP